MKKEYKKHRIINTISIPKLVTLQYFELEPDVVFKPESHDFWELVYVDKGYWQINTEDNSATLSQGQCYLHKPGETHLHKAAGGTAPNIFIVLFVCNSISMNYLKSKVINVPKSLRHLISNIIKEGTNTFDLPFNETELKEMQPLSNGIIGGEQMIKIYLEQFLILLLRNEYKYPDKIILHAEDLSAENLASKMKAILDTTAYQNISVEQFCIEMRYSKAYLSKIFLKSYGCTINAYMNKVKITEAKKLIRENNHNLSQISDMLCYSNPFYFSRVFKRITGMSPTEYKNAVKIN